jgi:Conserved TM helix/Mechanosensitive ion channel
MEKKLLDAFASLGNSIALAIPGIAIGILLTVLGLIVAKLIEVALRTMLVRIRFDSLAERAGVKRALMRIGLRQQLSLLLPKLAYSMVVVLIAKTASDAFGLIAISNAIGAFFSYLPNILAALLLLVLGTTLGQFTGTMVTQAAESSGLESASALGRIVSALIIFLVSMMAIGQLKIDTAMVRIVASILLGAGALAFGIAFGLGTRDIVRNLVTGFYTRRLLAVGQDLTIAGHTGILTAITSTHTVLNSEGYDIVVANSKFLDRTSTQRHKPVASS